MLKIFLSPFAGLPQHEVGQPGLARGPDEEVRGGGVPDEHYITLHYIITLRYITWCRAAA